METDKERFFSVEMKSKIDLKTLNLSTGPHDRVLVEGSIGELLQAVFIEDVLLEVAGDKGTLRINLKQCEIKKREVSTNGST